MYKKLEEIAEISTGYTFRKSIQDVSEGDIQVLQAKNILPDGEITDIDELTKIDSSTMRDPFLLKYNDIILVAKGFGIGSFRSAVFKEEVKNILPSSSVIILRVKDILALPKYLADYFNSEAGQKSLIQITSGGSVIQSLSVKDLKNLKIPIPPIKKQKLLIKLNENQKKIKEIQEQKNKLTNSIITNIFNNLTTK